MMTPVLRKALFISLLGHLTFFSIFNLSFGKKIPNADFAAVSFWGQCLRNSQVAPVFIPAFKRAKELPLASAPDTSMLSKKSQDALSLIYEMKPAITLSFNTEKEAFIEKPAILSFSPARKEPTIVLHPLLPYGFTLYFKDRQVAHVELMYNIASEDGRSSISVRRKISSGNLEADLLTMRHIEHYLFVQQANLAHNDWRTVKIDLSARD